MMNVESEPGSVRFVLGNSQLLARRLGIYFKVVVERDLQSWDVGY